MIRRYDLFLSLVENAIGHTFKSKREEVIFALIWTKIVLLYIFFLICVIFKQLLSLRRYPNEWKSASVTPLFKQGEQNDSYNYRSISVISVVAKVLERMVYGQLKTYMAVNDFMYKYQSGFRTIRSTVTALLEATDSWAYNVTEEKSMQWSSWT